MRKRRQQYLPIVALLVIVLGAAWFSDHLNGSSLEDSGEGSLTGMSKPRKGDDVYYLLPGLVNKSRQPLELKAIAPDQVQPGLVFIDARVYERPDRMDGAPLSWSTGEEDWGSPPKTPSKPVGSQKIAAESAFDGLVYLHYRVTSDARPLHSSGVAVTYHRGFRDHTQVVPAVFEVTKRTS